MQKRDLPTPYGTLYRRNTYEPKRETATEEPDAAAEFHKEGMKPDTREIPVGMETLRKGGYSLIHVPGQGVGDRRNDYIVVPLAFAGSGRLEEMPSFIRCTYRRTQRSGFVVFYVYQRDMNGDWSELYHSRRAQEWKL